MAGILNIIPNAYQKYEYGTREPKLEILYHIADYFCVSSDWLLGLSDDMKRDYFLTNAERKFYAHPKTSKELIERYKGDKMANPASLAPVLLRTCEAERDAK
ncbi:transcriptional regulator with XRE-family HTH domain [Pectinatus haikarae]|uniref:Transcriptional regulator with XRE-family HTH domain n=2 Tax=Pectinatus haikarae TaxID=349096 RepID=A0ABT9Y4W8_9FIRM|nr:transcriptional regulator with XRE-family HTH domain [Pectinatus haikarae]